MSADDPGPLERAVLADLARVRNSDSAIHETLNQVALYLARTIDDRGDTEGPSACARVVQELTKVLDRLTTTSEPAQDDFTSDLSEPKD